MGYLRIGTSVHKTKEKATIMDIITSNCQLQNVKSLEKEMFSQEIFQTFLAELKNYSNNKILYTDGSKNN